MKAVVLTGAYVRFTDRSDHDSVQRSIELVHSQRCLLHKVEYIFLNADVAYFVAVLSFAHYFDLFKQEVKTMQRWYLALRAAGCVPSEQLYTDPKVPMFPSVLSTSY